MLLVCSTNFVGVCNLMKIAKETKIYAAYLWGYQLTFQRSKNKIKGDKLQFIPLIFVMFSKLRLDKYLTNKFCLFSLGKMVNFNVIHNLHLIENIKYFY